MVRTRNRNSDGELDDRYLVNRIARYVDEGINGENGDVTEVRQTMFERYYGEEYGNERDGFSKYVSREVLEAVEWGLPALLRVFMGGVKAVEFRASGPEDEQQAEHETDVVNYWFYDGNDEYTGFLTLYSWLKDILMYPNGYVKVTLEESEEEETQSYRGLTREQLLAVQAVENDESRDVTVTVDRAYTGITSLGRTRFFDVTISEWKTESRIEVAPVPPDEVIIEHGHTKLDVDSARFSCLRTQYTRSELVEMGYDDEELDDVGPGDDETWHDERVTRLFYSDENPEDDSGEFDLPSDETFWRHECFMRVDFDGDGVSELRRIVMVGTKIFENEDIDYNPIVSASAIHVTHKHIGLSYAEIVSDLQEITSTLTRQMLDNIYKQNVRRTYIDERAMLSDNSTMDQLLDGNSEIIEIRGNPAEAVMPEMTQPIVSEIAAVMQMFSDKPQLRTGVAPQITLDPSVLKESTMGAFVGAIEQASQRLELLARLFAETGLKRVFQKIHYLLRTYFEGAQQVKINKQWVAVNPSTWKKRSNMNVNVGLGFNNKQAMITLLTTLLQIQREAMPAGLADQKKLFATLEKLIEQANMGHVGTYFIDPNQPNWKPPEPQPDAQMIAAQAQAKSLEADSKRRDAELKHKIEMDKAGMAEKKEGQELEAAKLMQKMEELQQNYERLVGELALKDAQIQKLNADAVAATMQPQTAEDEFARADTRVKGASGSKPKKKTDDSKTKEAA